MMDKAQALNLIHDERKRQISDEGWTEQHDDAHSDGEMARAATAYYLNATGRCAIRADGVPLGWPWDAQWWKPKGPLRDLVRAGALFLAEQERLFRLPGSFGLKHSRAQRMDSKIERVVKTLMSLPASEPASQLSSKDR